MTLSVVYTPHVYSPSSPRTLVVTTHGVVKYLAGMHVVPIGTATTLVSASQMGQRV